jgi:hypothetical protein
LSGTTAAAEQQFLGRNFAATTFVDVSNVQEDSFIGYVKIFLCLFMCDEYIFSLSLNILKLQ